MKLAVLRTLCYHDIFNYPLTLREIHHFLIGRKATLKEIQSTINHQPSTINNFENFYFLKGREETVEIRKRREQCSKEKLLIAKRVVKVLCLIPTIKMIALTGAVAVGNAKKNDDIDFLIVTAKDRLWLTRIQAVLLIELLANRPQLEEGKLKDTICLNVFLDENHLRIPKQKRNLFVAHEMVQMRVLWQKNNVYQKFLKANQWVKKFLPSWKR